MHAAATERADLEDGLPVDKFLRPQGDDGNHSQPAIVDLLGAHGEEFLRVILGGQLQGIKVQVPGREAFLQRCHSLGGALELPATVDVVRLENTDGEDGRDPEVGHLLADHLEMSEGRSELVVNGKERVEMLLNKEAHSGEHSNSPVLDLALLELLELQIVHSRSEAELKIAEKSKRMSDTTGVRARGTAAHFPQLTGSKMGPEGPKGFPGMLEASARREEAALLALTGAAGRGAKALTPAAPAPTSIIAAMDFMLALFRL
jgi:hypothetical protein